MTEAKADHRFQVSAVWSGDGGGSGEVDLAGGTLRVPFAGAKSLGGAGERASPEELLLAALGACFLNTWAIFLKKLALSYAEPTIRISGELVPDPSGGFRMEAARIYARVPSPLLAADRGRVEKTLQLAEKYCIISRAVRPAMKVEVEIEEV
jgi:organic hydroperoxide reductase OsmC/OhrA